MSDFTFVPRSIAKRKAPAPPSQRPKTIIQDAVISLPSSSSLSQLPSSSSGGHVVKSSSKFTTDDILTLLQLCLSRYSCWLDTKLFRTIQESKEGYVPVQYLLEHVPPFCELDTRPSELEIVHALRSASAENTEHNFEVRIIIQEPSRNEWFSASGSGGNAARPTVAAAGLFEIRRKDFEEVIRSNNINEQSDVGGYRNDWDSRTVYVERLPPTYRTKHAIARYISQLLIDAEDISGGECSKRDYPVQNVSFPPPHHSDPDKKASPRYKGFAFVVLDSPSLAKALCDACPWHAIDPGATAEDAQLQSDIDGARSTEATEAIKFGTRILSKISWDKLKDEYLSYQKSIMASSAEKEQEDKFGLNGAPQTQTALIPKQDVSDKVRDQTLDNAKNLTPPTTTTNVPIAPSKTYPENCLVFVKNVHSDTNKTTLRQLFVSILSSASAIDYVDFTKGIDSCHLRLRNSFEATKLVSHFAANVESDKAQLGALDNETGPPTADRPALAVELVQGKREEFYWEKVPQKLREKALVAARLDDESRHGTLQNKDDYDKEPEPEIAHRAKRRKRYR